MKRLFIFCVMCAFAFVANAQVRKFYYVDGCGYWVQVDLNKKQFLADGCGVDPEPIKNYKKAGNKESFTTYDGGYTTHHEFVKKTDTDYTYTYWRTPSESKEKATIAVTTKGGSSADGVKGKAMDKVDSKNPVKSVGEGVKGLFNKGKGLFKKDKSKDSKSDKNTKTQKKKVDATTGASPKSR